MQNVQVSPVSISFLRKNSQAVPGNRYCIYLIEEGKGQLKLDEDQIDLRRHVICFIAPYQKQKFSGLSGIKGYCISFTEEFMHFHTEHKDVLYRLPFFGYDLKQHRYILKPAMFTQLTEIAMLMHAEGKIKSQYQEKILLSYINIFLLKCKQLPAAKGERIDKSHYTSLQIVQHFKQLIRQNYIRQHSVAFYAAQLRQTNNYLNAVVKEVTGKTAGKIIQEHLIVEAKRMLIHTKLSAKEVAFELGFKDHSYFTKFFKKHTGLNPLAWFNVHK